MIFGTLPILFSCRDFSFQSYVKGEVVASVGDNELYYENISGVIGQGLSYEDSVKLINTCIDNWVKNQVKLQFAEEYYNGDLSEIERMVAEYRNSLLIFKYENEYICARLDTAVTAKEIDDFYLKNRTEFTLPASLVKAVAVKVPNGSRQESAMRNLSRSTRADNIQDIVDIAIKNDMDYIHYGTWTDYNEIISFMPQLSQQQYHDIQTKKGFYEVSEGGYRYMLTVIDILPEGGIMPLSMASTQIRKIILNKRRSELLRNLEDSLYSSAQRRGNIYLRDKPETQNPDNDENE